MKHDSGLEALKALPAASVGSGFIFGVPLPTAVLVVTGVYYVLLVVTLVRDKWFSPWWRKRDDRSE